MMGDRKWGNPEDYSNRQSRRADAAIQRKRRGQRGENFTKPKRRKK